MIRLITLQKRAVRVMTFSRFDAHSEPLFEKLDIMPLKKDYFLMVSRQKSENIKANTKRAKQKERKQKRAKVQMSESINERK
jgi:hypothetical protein